MRAPLKTRRQSQVHIREPLIPTVDEGEASFWNTPGAAARTLHFTGESLMDEEVDLANISTASFGTPVVVKKTYHIPLQENTPQPELPEDVADEDEVDDALAYADEAAEATVIMGAPPSELRPEEVIHEPDQPDLPPQVVEIGPTSAEMSGSRQKIKVTTELERIVVRRSRSL